jgi:hypothetical protein
VDNASAVDEQLAHQTGQMHITPSGSDETQEEEENSGPVSTAPETQEPAAPGTPEDSATTQSGV